MLIKMWNFSPESRDSLMTLSHVCISSKKGFFYRTSEDVSNPLSSLLHDNSNAETKSNWLRCELFRIIWGLRFSLFGCECIRSRHGVFWQFYKSLNVFGLNQHVDYMEILLISECTIIKIDVTFTFASILGRF